MKERFMSFRVPTMLCLVFATVTGCVSAAVADLSGSIVIAGNGPELPTIERLARAFEKNHHGSVVEIQWDQYQGWRCLLCGEVIDPGIIANRKGPSQVTQRQTRPRYGAWFVNE